MSDYTHLLEEQNELLKAQLDALLQARPSPSPVCDSTSMRDSCPSTVKVPLPLVINFLYSQLFVTL